MEVASGLGKSYIIILAVAVLLYWKIIKQVLIVYSEPEIQSQEQKHVAMIREILGSDDKVTTRVHRTLKDFNFNFKH